MGWDRRLGVIASLVVLPLLLSATGLLKMYLAGPLPPGWGGDAYGHLFKIWKLHSHGFSPWIEDWYSGYPFLRFYPPLSYFMAWAASIPLGDPALAYKVIITLSLVIASLSTYLLGRELGFSEIPSIIMGISFSINPWLFRMISPEGNFPRVVGASLAPLSIACFVRLAKERDSRSICALPIAALPLTHHSLAVVVAPLAGFLWLTALVDETSGLEDLALKLKNTLSTVAWAFIITSFWMIPFILERNLAHFLNENSIDYLYMRQSVPLIAPFIDWGPWSFYQGSTRMLLALLSLPASIFALRRSQEADTRVLSTLISSFLVLVSLMLSLGAKGPVPWLNRLPLLSMIPPYRWLDLTQLSAAVALGGLLEMLVSLSRRRWLTLLLILLVVPLYVESAPRMTYLAGTDFDPDLERALQLVGRDPDEFRFHQQGIIFRLGSMVSYSPALAGKPSLNGWYRQGDPLYPQHIQMEWEIENGRKEAGEKLAAFGVKYVLVDLNVSRGLNLLKDLGFVEVGRYGSIEVLRWDSGSILSCEECELKMEEWGDGYIRFRYSSNSSAKVRVSEAWYPHWTVKVDGRDLGAPARDELGLILIQMEPGTHVVELVFRDPLLMLSQAASLTATIYALVRSLMPRREKWRRPWT